MFAGRSLEVKLLTIWTDGKAEVGRVREEKRREEKRREEKRREEEMIREEKESEETSCRCAKSRKGRKVAKHCVFPLICVSGGSKRKPAKAAGAEPSGQMRDVKLIPTPIEGEGGGGQNQPVEFHFFLLGNPGIVIHPLEWNCKVTFINKPWARV